MATLFDYTAGTGTQVADDTNHNGYGIQVQSGSDLIGRNITSIFLDLKRSSSTSPPPTSGIYVGVWDSNQQAPDSTFSNASYTQWSDFPTSYESIEFTGSHTIAENDIIGYTSVDIPFRNLPGSLFSIESYSGVPASNVEDALWSRSTTSWSLGIDGNMINMKLLGGAAPSSGSTFMPPPIAMVRL